MRRLKKLFVACGLFTCAASAVLYLGLPHYAPVMLRRYLDSSGGNFEHCVVTRTSWLTFSSPGCAFSVAAGGGLIKIAGENMSVSFGMTILNPAISIGSLKIDIPDGTGEKQSSPAAQKLLLPFSQLEIAQGEIRFGSKLNLKFSGAFRKAAGEDLDFEIVIAGLKYSPFPDELKGKFSGKFKDGIISGAYTSSETGTLPASAALDYNAAEKSGRFDFKLGPVSFTQQQSLAKHYALVPEMDFDAGTAAISGKIQWGEKLQIETEIKGQDLGGHYREVSFSGADGTLNLINVNGWETTAPAQLKIQSIDAGIQLRDTTLQLRVKKKNPDSSDIVLNSVSTSLLGGTIGSGRIEFAEGALQTFVLDVNALDLTRVMELSGEAVQGSGLLSGRIPVDVSAGRMRVTDGLIEALPPGGFLKYTASPAARESALHNPNLQLALSALEQFNYEKLSAKLQYAPDGEMLAEVSLLGKNPNLFEGRAIQFNINLEQNLPALLRSLRLARRPL